MWSRPLSLMAGGGATVTATINSDTLVGDLWSFLGSPSGNQDVEIIVDGVMAGDIQITVDWGSFSTFQFTCINGGQIVGLGGGGGRGGNQSGDSGSSAGSGWAGGNALTSIGFAVNVDIDDGYLLGGGGGGGGGAYHDNPGLNGGTAGSGGGGGQGFAVTAGGQAGTGEFPVGVDGGDGGPAGPGLGGGGVFTSETAGGKGGKWGSAGQFGGNSDLFAFDEIGGWAPLAGRAFSSETGGSVTFNGASSEAVLRAEGRIKGEIGPDNYLSMTNSLTSGDTHSSAVTAGFKFSNNGNVTLVRSFSGDDVLTDKWQSATTALVGDDYEIRSVSRAGSNDLAGTWTVAPTVNVWQPLSGDVTWTRTTPTSVERTTQLFQIRRNDVPGNPDDEIISTFLLYNINDVA